MRSEKEMLDLIRRTALEDDNIRAAYIEGSRANPNVPRDIFQDYDIEYIVNDTKPYRENRTWIDRFGERLYMQYPDEGPYGDADVESWYGWLIQLADGNRLDLHVGTKEHALANLELYEVLVDKDHILPKMEEDSDAAYWVKKPSEEEFLSVCNEFWWCLNNVAKGLWREELPYVMDMIDMVVRPQLKKLLEWKIGSEHDFKISAGKFGKYMSRYLSESNYKRFLSTYAKADTKAVWEAVFHMCDLFQETAVKLARVLGFEYNLKEAENSRRFLEDVRILPKDAAEVY